MNQTAVQRSYKNSLFREKKELLSLYNALNGKDYVNPEALTITTIEDVLYMGLKNDISFLIEDVMNLYEGQSSWNPSIPLRGLFYISQIYQGYVKEQHLDIYSSVLLRIPTPNTEEIKEKIETENSLETLQHWMTLTWDCDSIEELSRQILASDALPNSPHIIDINS